MCTPLCPCSDDLYIYIYTICKRGRGSSPGRGGWALGAPGWVTGDTGGRGAPLTQGALAQTHSHIRLVCSVARVGAVGVYFYCAARSCGSAM